MTHHQEGNRVHGVVSCGRCKGITHSKIRSWCQVHASSLPACRTGQKSSNQSHSKAGRTLARMLFSQNGSSVHTDRITRLFAFRPSFILITEQSGLVIMTAYGRHRSHRKLPHTSCYRYREARTSGLVPVGAYVGRPHRATASLQPSVGRHEGSSSVDGRSARA